MSVQFALKAFEVDGRRRLVAVIRDITASKRVEEELRTSESRLSEAQRIARFGNWEYLLGRMDNWSKAT